MPRTTMHCSEETRTCLREVGAGSERAVLLSLALSTRHSHAPAESVGVASPLPVGAPRRSTIARAPLHFSCTRSGPGTRCSNLRCTWLSQSRPGSSRGRTRACRSRTAHRRLPHLYRSPCWQRRPRRLRRHQRCRLPPLRRRMVRQCRLQCRRVRPSLRAVAQGRAPHRQRLRRAPEQASPQPRVSGGGERCSMRGGCSALP